MAVTSRSIDVLRQRAADLLKSAERSDRMAMQSEHEALQHREDAAAFRAEAQSHDDACAELSEGRVFQAAAE